MECKFVRWLQLTHFLTELQAILISVHSNDSILRNIILFILKVSARVGECRMKVGSM